MELGPLQSLITMLRENGITHYKDGELELQLGAAPVQGSGKEEDKSETVSAVDKALAGLNPGYKQLFTVDAGAENH